MVISVLAVVVVVVSGVAACSSAADVGTVIAEIDKGDGYFSDPVIFDDGAVYYLRYSSNNSDGPDSLGRVDPSGQDGVVDLPDLVSGECFVGHVWSLRGLADGRLGLVARCPGPEASNASVSFALDRGTWTVARLGAAYGGYDVVWQPGFREGWVGYAEPGCSSMAPLTPDGLMPVPSYSPKDLLPWSLDAGFHPHSTCVSDGRVTDLELSDSGQLYFMGSPDSIGVNREPGGFSRDDIGWNLYALDLHGWGLRKVADGFFRPRGLAVAAGGQHVVVSSDRGEGSGLWVVDMSSGSVTSLASGGYQDVGMSGRDKTVVAVRTTEHSYQIVLLAM